MNIKVLLLFLIQFCFVSTTQIDVPVSFRRMGYYATGLSYAHLKTNINIENVRKLNDQAKAVINSTAKNAADLTDNSVSMIQLFAKLERSLIPSTSLINAITSTFVEENRPKRQLEIAAVFSLGLSLYNTYEIHQLHKSINSLEAGMEVIAHSILEEDLAITHVESNLAHLNATCFILTKALYKTEQKVNHLAAFDELFIIITQHNQEVSRWAEGMNHLLHGQLSPLLIKNKSMVKSFMELKNKVQENQFRLLRENPSDIYKEEISYLVEGNIVHIYVHLPIIERDPLALYEHINIPFFSDTNGAMVTLESAGNFLALDENTKVGIELTTNELTACKKQPHHLGNIYLCESANLLNTNVLTTCLGLLFSGSHNAIEINNKCKLFINKEEHFGKQLSRNSFLMFNKNPTKLTYKCGSNIKHEMISGLTRVEALPACQVFTDSYLFYSKVDITIEAEFINLPRKIDFTFNETPLIELTAAYNELSLITHPTKRSVDEVRTWLAREKSRRMTYQHGIIAFLIVLALILAVCAYLGFTYYKYKRGKAPTVRSQEPAMELAALNQN